ncbi:MAG: acyl-CoA desaturase [Kofleriaceae bacterium]|nr:acyl-CoA desaturase [Myxococcales bacterium]MCB9562527.1 acyl-CoA desaturase [Kofleriaceae bacterium]
MEVAVSPEHPASSRGNRPRFAPDNGFRKRLDERVAAYFADTGRSPHGGWRMRLKTASMLAWFGASYAFLVFVASTWWQGVLGATSLAFAIAGIGFSIMHDANHDAYSKHKLVNRLLERTLDMLGASSYIWRWKHNVFHHTYTNVEGADNDIHLLPFARLAPTQPRRRIHRFQHLYMWALYGFTVYHMHFTEDFLNVKRGKVGPHHFPRPRGLRLFEVFASKAFVLAWSLAIPMFFHTWWVVLAFYASLWFAVGIILGVVFQVAHCHDEAPFPEPDPVTNRIDNAWAIHQVETTADFAPHNPLITWYVGGLNFQIEHHLFPKICHVHYPRLAGIVQDVCTEFGVRYTQFPSFVSAVASHGRMLRRMGTAPDALPAAAATPAAAA